MELYIYKTTNIINKKYYIGKHIGLKNDDYLGSGKLLKAAIRKYGKSNFKKEILIEATSLEELNELEKQYVTQKEIDDSNCYNLKLGGEGGWDYINKIGKNGTILGVTRQKLLRNSNLEWKNNWKKKHKDAISKFSKKELRIRGNKISRSLKKYYENHEGTFKNKKHNEIVKQKIGIANSIHQKGTNNSNYGKCWIYNNNLKQSISIKKDELNNYLKLGWIKGRKMKF